MRAEHNNEYHNRTVKIYPITDAEMKDIHILAIASAWHYSLAGICTGALIACIIAGIVADDHWSFVPCGALAALAFALSGIGRVFQQRSMRIIELIHDQCGDAQ